MILVGGDKCKDGHLTTKHGLNPVGNALFAYNRSTLDPVLNYAGLCLAQLVHKFDLDILNRAVPGDYPAQFTYWSSSKHSTIDYLLSSQDLFKRVTRLLVDARTESDHLPLRLR